MIANFFWDIWTGDIVALSMLFGMFLPFILIYAAIQAAIDKARKK